MKKAIDVATKRRRRAPGERGPSVHLRLPQDIVDAIDAYSITERTTRSEAFRRLIKLGLKARATGLIW
jgi:hypothetical protein